MHVSMPGHTLGVCIFCKRAEVQAERFMRGMRELLPAKVNHLVAVQSVLDLFDLGICRLRDSHAADLGAQRGGQRLRSERSILSRVVVELARGMKSHVCRPASLLAL